jgi:hypothetical protein
MTEHRDQSNVVDRSYDELVDRYLQARDLGNAIERRMLDQVPGSARGQGLYKKLEMVRAEETERRREMLNHPDAPPQG